MTMDDRPRQKESLKTIEEIEYDKANNFLRSYKCKILMGRHIRMMKKRESKIWKWLLLLQLLRLL